LRIALRARNRALWGSGGDTPGDAGAGEPPVAPGALARAFRPTCVVTLTASDGDLARRRDGFRLDVRTGRLWSAEDRHRARAGVGAARAALAALEAVEEPDEGHDDRVEAARASLEAAEATAAQLEPEAADATGAYGEDGAPPAGAVLVPRPEDRGPALVALRGRYRAQRPRLAFWRRAAHARTLFVDALQPPAAVFAQCASRLAASRLGEAAGLGWAGPRAPVGAVALPAGQSRAALLYGALELEPAEAPEGETEAQAAAREAAHAARTALLLPVARRFSAEHF